MPTGDRRLRPRPRGFSYLALLFMLAVGSAALAALATLWRTTTERERETELLFRGHQIAQALGRYAAATPAGQPLAPDSLEELLEDRRTQPPQRHLRRLYADPFTGQPDWQLLRDAQGGIVGLHSRATQRAWRRHDTPAPARAGAPAVVGDWRFMTETGSTPATRRNP